MKQIVKRIASYKKIIVLLLLITVIICAIIIVVPIFNIKSSDTAITEQAPLSTQKEQLAVDAGKVLVAETDTKELYVDTKNCNLRVVDKAKKVSWNAIYEKKDATPFEKALLSINYLGEDNKIYTWDTYQYCVELGTYEIFTIENGVQIRLHVNEGQSLRLYEHMPEKMNTDRFENFFLAGLDQLAESGTIDKTLADKYKSTLSLIYKKSLKEDCYSVNYVGTPPASAIKQLIEIADAVGYTEEMLMEDYATFNLIYSVAEVAAFDITLEATLDGDDFIVRVPMQEIISQNDYYAIQNVDILPNFGLTTTADTEEGYLFVPDGAGALIKMNSYNSAIAGYETEVYDNTYFSDYFFAPEYEETITMPVFGMLCGPLGQAATGFLGIIENGAETSYITAKPASESTDGGGSPFNKVYASFDEIQMNAIKVFGPYSDEAATFLVKTNPLKVDYTIRYRLYPDEVSYFDMAKDYQAYLIEKNDLKEPSYAKSLELYLNVIGTLSITKHFLGLPYNSEYSMTTYSQMEEIIKDLDGFDVVIEYTGSLNNGMLNEAANQAEPVKENGSKKELEQMLTSADESGTQIFFGMNFLKIYQNGNGYYPRFKGTYNYYNEWTQVYGYDLADGRFTSQSNICSLLSPRYLLSVVDAFLKDSDEFDHIGIQDMAELYLADYHNNAMISGYEANAAVKEALSKLSETKVLSLTNPMMDKAIYGTYAVDISRKSSEYKAFYTTIPFRQLVMNGLTKFTTQDINMSSEEPDYYLLQALELGAIPKYTISSDNVDVLRNTKYSYLYSVQYDLLKDDIKELFEETSKVLAQAGSLEITNHIMLQENVFKTTYASGFEVIVNYNYSEVETEYGTVGAMGYLTRWE